MISSNTLKHFNKGFEERMIRKNRSLPRLKIVIVVTLLNVYGIAVHSGAATSDSPTSPVEIITEWETFYSDDMGLESDHIFTIKSDGERLWVGTEGGLTLFEKNRWRSWTEENGLPWNIVMGIDVSDKTGDIWLATFGGGLVRMSGGRFDQFTQMNSGLVNDVLYGVAVSGDEIWAATAAGLSVYDTVTGSWRIFNEKNCILEV
jgi:hypothetical protein